MSEQESFPERRIEELFKSLDEFIEFHQMEWQDSDDHSQADLNKTYNEAKRKLALLKALALQSQKYLRAKEKKLKIVLEERDSLIQALDSETEHRRIAEAELFQARGMKST